MPDMTGGIDTTKLKDRFKVLSLVFNNESFIEESFRETLNFFNGSDDENIRRWTRNLNDRLDLKNYIDRFCMNARDPNSVKEFPIRPTSRMDTYIITDFSGQERSYSLIEYLARHPDIPFVTIEGHNFSTYDERADDFIPDGDENLDMYCGFILSDADTEIRFPVYSVGQAIEISGMVETDDQRFEAETLLYFIAGFCYFSMRQLGLPCSINGERNFILDKDHIKRISHYAKGADTCFDYIKDFIRFFP